MVVNSGNIIAKKLVINARYKRYNLQQKREFIEEASQAGSSISIVARKYGLAPSVLFNWRRRMEDAALVGLEQAKPWLQPPKLKSLRTRFVSLKGYLVEKPLK